MDNKISKLLALILVLCTLCASMSSIVLPVGADNASYSTAEDVEYMIYGKYTANWGLRGEVSIFLSIRACDFYSLKDNSYEELSELEGGSGQSDAHSSELYSALKSLMSSKHSHITTYQETRDLYKYTDCERNDIAKISSFYSGHQLSGAWDSGATWNREHTWPRSKCIDTSKKNDSADIMMIRPTWVSENSSRGNDAYGESSGYFEPADSVKGDCARIALYGYTRWGNTGRMWGSDGMIESVEVLLAWMELDPVDTWEMGRNDAVQAITGTRNVFVDYPEYAFLLFGEEIPEDMTTPSGATSSGDTESDAETSLETQDKTETTAKPSTDTGNAADAEAKSGCGSVLCSGVSVTVISISLAGYMLLKKEKLE